MAQLVANGKPGLITSLGAFVALGTALFNMASSAGEQRESSRRQDQSSQRAAEATKSFEQRMTESNRRQWDSLTDLRKELKDDLRHEVLMGCHCTTGSRP